MNLFFHSIKDGDLEQNLPLLFCDYVIKCLGLWDYYFCFKIKQKNYLLEQHNRTKSFLHKVLYQPEYAYGNN